MDKRVSAPHDVTSSVEGYLRGAPAMIHSIDREGRFRFVSDFWLRKLGYLAHEIIGQKCSLFLTPASSVYLEETMLPRIFTEGRSENIEYQMICKSGQIMDVLVSSVVDWSAVGGPATLSVVTDITAQKTAERKLIESEARYRSIVDDQTELVVVGDRNFVLQFVNTAFAKLYGVEADEMIGRSMFDFVPQHAHAQLREQLLQAMTVTHALAAENEVVQADGSLRWVAWSNRAIRDAEGNVTAIHSVGRDIHERRIAEHKLIESEARYRMLADYSTDMVFHCDRDLVRRYISPACHEILGFEPEDLNGRQGLDMLHPDDVDRIAAAFKSITDGETDRGFFSYRVRHRDGRWLWAETSARATRDPVTNEPNGLIGRLRDVTAKKEVEDRLAEASRRLEILAAQDGLTEIYNRRVFDEMLEREVRIARREGTTLSLLMIDVDVFKAFNDCYGHPAGDAALRKVSAVIRASIKRPGDLAARYGGEEFAVLLPNTDADGAAAVAQAIRAGVEDLGMENSASAWKVLTVSIGVASADNRLSGGIYSDCLVKGADKALYAAKRGGRNTIVSWSEEPEATLEDAPWTPT
jgi:diguanylate cyclase (GGDEF)-like protein/PAS domain S-box-containing protein